MKVLLLTLQNAPPGLDYESDKKFSKLKICKSISYVAVAAHADKSGRRKWVAMLVEHEPSSSKPVPLLLSIGEEDTALTKATESGDTDLVYLVLFNIWQKML
ncbi:Protein VACUOLELESS1 [Camellia lanceoleosa]|uniref:Protein VACUOLELESS1 n=1 Tax=Camellia lanceoleosa TaxID=1840588 RepID=A0ACC0IIG4_9ERIC|nr:Protein VACUOLELESS1 [Camellia lanceoleosa]